MISKTKNKDIDFDDLILKVKNDAKELMKKKSKQQKYSKSRRQGLLIGGAYVKLDDEVKDGLRAALSKIAPLVLLLKHTVKVKMANKFSEFVKNNPNDNATHNRWALVESLIHNNLIQTTDSEGIENATYGYDVFESTFRNDAEPKTVIDYKEYGIKKEIETLNSFKILFKLLNIEPADDPDKGTLYHGGVLEVRSQEEINEANALELQKNEKFKQDTNKEDFKFVAAPLDDNFITMTDEQRKASILNMTDVKKNVYKDFREKQILPIKDTVLVTDAVQEDPSTGGAPTKYKSTGQVVYIVYKNKKYKRSIYTKEKGKTKYCKMNNKYILLSKCKVIV